MYIVSFCSLLTLLLTFLESWNKASKGMMIGFIIITFLGMIHYDYGNDYMPYYDLYKQITSYTFNYEAIIDKQYYREAGWVLLSFFFKPIGGFFMMVAVLNIIQNIIVYKFIRDNVNKRWWTFSVFVYLFVTSYYLMSFSMMRQMFVVIVFLGMWRFIQQRNWWIPLVVIYICSYIHSSAIVLLPFAFWGFIPVNNAKYVGIGYVVLLGGLWMFGNTLNDIFQFALSIDEDFKQYADTYENDDNTLKLGFGFLINMIPFALSIKYLLSKEKNDWQKKSLVAIAAISFLITPFSQIIRLVSRIGSYFGIFSIATLPLIYGNIKKKGIRNILLILYILIVMYDYYLFFTDSVFAEKYSTFHTIFLAN